MHKVAASLGLVGLTALTLLTGCSNGIGTDAVTTAVTPAVQGVHGVVQGGQSPVTGATIQLWAVGSTAYGTGATALISATVTSSDGTGIMNSNANAGNVNNTLSTGNFTITGDYTCPTSTTLVYLTATGGNPGLTSGTNNSALVLMAPLGQCGSLSSSTFVSINEVTTVASTLALAQFMGASGSIGSTSSTTAALASAFANVNNLVNVPAGSALGTNSNGDTVPQTKLDSLADILVPCVNSAGPTSAACTTLFSDATPSGGSAPTTVLGAALDIALNPANNVASLYSIATANTAFQPTLTSAPVLWNVVPTGGAETYCGNSGGGYTVSGTVSYSGAHTGQIYLALSNNSGCDAGTQGTSISSTGAYTIRGVQSGQTYTLYAFMDTLGKGAQNAADPAGSTASFTVSGNLTGENITLTDPSTVTLTSAPSISTVSPFNTGVVALYTGIKNNGVEAATTYTLQWSTSNSFSTIAGSQTFPATGTHGANFWGVNGLTNGGVYYFRAYGTSGGTAVSPYSSIVGPITVAANTSGSTVTGSVSFTGTATGPMYVGLYNNYNGAVYGEYIQSPASLQAYSVVVPNSSTPVYTPFALIDQNNDGVVDPGDIQNTNTNLNTLVSITGSTANENIVLPSSNAISSVQTSVFKSGSTLTYALSFQASWAAKLPVALTLEASSNSDGANVVGPMDIALCGQNGTNCGGGFGIQFNLNSTAPAVGDTYFFNATYSDGTTGTLTAPVTAVLNDFPTNLAPTTGTSTTPTLTWTAPSCSCTGYTYVVVFSSIGSTNGTIWEVPGQSDGLPFTTTSLVWGVDPYDSANLPSPSTLTVGTNYTWDVNVQDQNGNSSATVVNYQP